MIEDGLISKFMINIDQDSYLKDLGSDDDWSVLMLAVEAINTKTNLSINIGPDYIQLTDDKNQYFTYVVWLTNHTLKSAIYKVVVEAIRKHDYRNYNFWVPPTSDDSFNYTAV